MPKLVTNFAQVGKVCTKFCPNFAQVDNKFCPSWYQINFAQVGVLNFAQVGNKFFQFGTKFCPSCKFFQFGTN